MLSGAGQWGKGGCHGKVEEVEGDGVHQGMMLHHLQPLLMCHDCSPLLHPGLYIDIHITHTCILVMVLHKKHV